MRRIHVRGACAALTTCALSLAGPAFASGTGMPWEAPLQKVVDSVTGPIVQFAAVCAVVLLGGGIAISENGSTLRRGLGVLFGISIMFAATTFFLDFFGFAGGLEIG